MKGKGRDVECFEEKPIQIHIQIQTNNLTIGNIFTLLVKPTESVSTTGHEFWSCNISFSFPSGSGHV